MKKLNIKEAATAARLSQWAYLDEHKFRAAVILNPGGWGNADVHFIEDKGTDTQCYVVNHNRTSWVAFRGTESVKDWLTDLDFSKSAHHNLAGQVHDGFASAFNSVWWKIRNLIKNPDGIIITGHSLGAALSILASSCVVGRHSATYAFCAPRVGDHSFSDYMERYNNTWCFSRHKDPVVRMPPYTMGYRHVGQQCYFHSDGRLDLHTTPWERYEDGVFGDMKDYLRLGDSLADHSIEWIADRLEVLANG